MRTPTALAITTVALLGGAAPAWGASPVVVGAAGNGGTPDIAVGASGTAHIVWEDSAPAIEQVRYCQLPRGGGACVNPKTFVGTQPMDDDGISGRPHVFVSSPNAVTVFQQRGLNGSGFMMANRSTDGGLTFGSRNRTGAAFPSSAAPREAVYGPGDTITSHHRGHHLRAFVQNGSPLDDTAAMFHSQILSSDSGEDAAHRPPTSPTVGPYDRWPSATQIHAVPGLPFQLAPQIVDLAGNGSQVETIKSRVIKRKRGKPRFCRCWRPALARRAADLREPGRGCGARPGAATATRCGAGGVAHHAALDNARVAVIALIDGEHHPASVRDALARLDGERGLAAIAFCGGEEKLPAGPLDEVYGRPVQDASRGCPAPVRASRRSRGRPGRRARARSERQAPPRRACPARGPSL